MVFHFFVTFSVSRLDPEFAFGMNPVVVTEGSPVFVCVTITSGGGIVTDPVSVTLVPSPGTADGELNVYEWLYCPAYKSHSMQLVVILIISLHCSFSPQPP